MLFLYTLGYTFFQSHTVKFHQFIDFHLFSFFYMWIWTFPFNTGWWGCHVYDKFFGIFSWSPRLGWFWICCSQCFWCPLFCPCHGAIVPLVLQYPLKSQPGWLKFYSLCPGLLWLLGSLVFVSNVNLYWSTFCTCEVNHG